MLHYCSATEVDSARAVTVIVSDTADVWCRGIIDGLRDGLLVDGLGDRNQGSMSKARRRGLQAKSERCYENRAPYRSFPVDSR